MNSKEYKAIALKQYPEKMIQTEIMDHLKGKGFYDTRMNSGQLAVGESRDRRFIMGHEKGTGDVLIGIPYKYLVLMGFIEVKRVGGILSHWQKQFQQEMQERKIFYCIAHNVVDVDESLQGFLANLQSLDYEYFLDTSDWMVCSR